MKSSIQYENTRRLESTKAGSKLFLALKLMRPLQWIKNAFVFVGIIFSGKFTDYQLLLQAVYIAFVFSLVSSSVYILNDLFDRENDRRHPRKSSRPLASGEISPGAGGFLMLVCLVTGLTAGMFISPVVAGLLIIYVLQNLAYSKLLKNVVILDVFIIALGFMLRILAGTLGLGITPSRWMMLCSLMVTLFIGFGKRRAEICELEEAVNHRAVLESYSLPLLDKMMGITASGVIITYSLYTVDSSTIALHRTDALIYTVPFVIYGVLRYLYIIHRQGGGGDPSKLVVKDPHILADVLLWLLAVLLILHWR